MTRQLLLRTKGACRLDPEHLVEVVGRQRQRFAAVLRGFGPAEWGAGPAAAEVADALAGRAPAAVLSELPATSRTALSRMADFFNTPVPDRPPG